MIFEKGGDSAGFVAAQADLEPTKRQSTVKRDEFPEWDLFARMSHEMRTPLGAILGFAQLIESGRPAPTASQKRSLDLILQAGWDLERIIGMAGDLARLESGTLSLSLEAVPLAAVMHDCQSVIEAQARGRGVQVAFPMLASTCFVWADRIRLQQALGNMLTAAIEYGEMAGALVVDCETQGSGWIRIHISGSGTSEGPRPPLVQANDGLDQDAALEDAGIGLHLAKSLIESMEGVIRAETRIGTRDFFSFDLKQMFLPMPENVHVALDDSGTSAVNAIRG
jgi:signal transduction histidine kinase